MAVFFVGQVLKATQTEMMKKVETLETSQKFLTGQLSSTLHKHEGSEAIERMQRKYDRAIRGLEQKELDSIVHNMDARNLDFIDQDGDGKYSTSELQAFVDLAVNIDLDSDGGIDQGERMQWIKMIQENTVWLGNIQPGMAKMKNLREVMKTKFGPVILITLTMHNDVETRELNRTGTDKGTPTLDYDDPDYRPRGAFADCPGLLERFPERSWAIVTFTKKIYAEACLAYEWSERRGWDTKAWEAMAEWNVSEWHGSDHLGAEPTMDRMMLSEAVAKVPRCCIFNAGAALLVLPVLAS